MEKGCNWKMGCEWDFRSMGCQLIPLIVFVQPKKIPNRGARNKSGNGPFESKTRPSSYLQGVR